MQRIQCTWSILTSLEKEEKLALSSVLLDEELEADFDEISRYPFREYQCEKLIFHASSTICHFRYA
jgi:hypothetical protein